MNERQARPESFPPSATSASAADAETAPMPRVEAEPNEGFRRPDIKGGVIVAGPNMGRHYDTFEAELPTPRPVEAAPLNPQQVLQDRRDELAEMAEAFTAPEHTEKYNKIWAEIGKIDEQMRGVAPRSSGRRPYDAPSTPSAPAAPRVVHPASPMVTNSPAVKDPAGHAFFEDAAHVPATEKDVEDYGVALLEQRDELLAEVESLNRQPSTPENDALRDQINSKIDSIDATFRSMDKNQGTKWSIRAGVAYENTTRSATRWTLDKLSKGAEYFKSMEADKKRRVLKVAGVALGGVIATGAVLLAHKAGMFDQLGDIMGDTPTPKSTPPVEVTTEVIPTPKSTKEVETILGEIKTPRHEDVTTPVAQEVSKAARHIKPGEGWYTTLKELDIPKKQWDKLLANDDLREQLVKNGDAYVMPDGSLGMNDNPSHKLGMDSIRDIQHAAGIDTTPEVPKVEHEGPRVEDSGATTIDDTTETPPSPEPSTDKAGGGADFTPTPQAAEQGNVLSDPRVWATLGVAALGTALAIKYRGPILDKYDEYEAIKQRRKAMREAEEDADLEPEESLAEWLFNNPNNSITRMVDVLAHVAERYGQIKTPEEAAAVLARLHPIDEKEYNIFLREANLVEADRRGFTQKDIEVLNGILAEIADGLSVGSR